MKQERGLMQPAGTQGKRKWKDIAARKWLSSQVGRLFKIIFMYSVYCIKT